MLIKIFMGLINYLCKNNTVKGQMIRLRLINNRMDNLLSLMFCQCSTHQPL